MRKQQICPGTRESHFLQTDGTGPWYCLQNNLSGHGRQSDFEGWTGRHWSLYSETEACLVTFSGWEEMNTVSKLSLAVLRNSSRSCLWELYFSSFWKLNFLSYLCQSHNKLFLSIYIINFKKNQTKYFFFSNESFLWFQKECSATKISLICPRLYMESHGLGENSDHPV